MNFLYVPNSPRAAGRQVRMMLVGGVKRTSTAVFVRGWCSVAYLFPGLHPDGFDEAGSGWPRVLRAVAAEAWRRASAGEIGDEELYPSDAQWAGLYDRMLVHLPEETERRVGLAASYGLPVAG